MKNPRELHRVVVGEAIRVTREGHTRTGLFCYRAWVRDDDTGSFIRQFDGPKGPYWRLLGAARNGELATMEERKAILDEECEIALHAILRAYPEAIGSFRGGCLTHTPETLAPWLQAVQDARQDVLDAEAALAAEVIAQTGDVTLCHAPLPPSRPQAVQNEGGS